MSNYRCLSTQIFVEGNFSIVPIRNEDRYDIMNWRNEQIFHLRQKNFLTVEDQEEYFSKTIFPLFDQETPNQILFSYLEKDICIGYGGLVHINWKNKNAELSFIMKTSLEMEYFTKHWKIFLRLIEKVFFTELQFETLTTFAFDLRPQLYKVIEESGFIRQSSNFKFINNIEKSDTVVIHSKNKLNYFE